MLSEATRFATFCNGRTRHLTRSEAHLPLGLVRPNVQRQRGDPMFGFGVGMAASLAVMRQVRAPRCRVERSNSCKRGSPVSGRLRAGYWATADRVESHSVSDEVYPVTQLWNSLLGLIVLPQERDVDRIPATRMSERWAVGWPRITVAGREHRTLRHLVRDLRNAVSHFNVEFEAGRDQEIHSVLVWVSVLDSDGRPKPTERGWQGRMTVEDLRQLAE